MSFLHGGKRQLFSFFFLMLLCHCCTELLEAYDLIVQKFVRQ